MTNMRDDIDHVLISEEDLHKRIQELGEQISADYKGKCPLLVSVLRGSFIFMADLTRHIQPFCQVDFMAVSSYGAGTVSSVNLLKEQVKVRLEDSTEQPKSYLTDEIRVVRNGKGKRPESYVAPSKAELEKLRTQEGERLRTGPKLDGPADLGEVLNRYLSDSQPKQPDNQKQGNRRNRNGQNRPQNQPRQQQGQGQPRPQRQQQVQPKPAPQNGGGQPAEAKSGQNQNHKRRYRPHHRHRPGGGQGQAPQN